MLCHAATRSPTTLIVALLAIFHLVAATCYRPNGSAVDDIYRPRDESAEFSTCCRAGATRDADHGDEDSNDEEDGGDARAPVGLCGAPGTQLWRGSCTDPTWTSPACLTLCADGDYAAAADAEITTCSDGSFCCGAGNSGCCERGEGVLIIDGKIISLPRQKRGTKPAFPSSATSTATRSARVARRALSSEAITGLAVAGAFGVVGALTVAVYVAAKWKTAGKPTDAVALPSGALPSHHAVSLAPSPASASASFAPLYYHSTPLWGSTYGRTELDSSTRPQELPGCPAGAELPSRKYDRW